jgi:hypothetical protein
MKRHDVFTMEQLEQDSLNLEDLVTSLQGPENDLCRVQRMIAQQDARITLSLLLFVFKE